MINTSGESARLQKKYYSQGCDVKQSKWKYAISLPHFKEYCTLVNFQKEGNGIIQYFDDYQREVYVLFGTWRKGKLCGKAILYNTSMDCIESILFFCDGNFVDEIPMSPQDKQFTIITNEDGYRWEGYTQNGVAMDRGDEYNQVNDKVFSGWYYDNCRLGKGESYHSQESNQCVLCNRGYWHNGREFGPFEIYDKKGNYIHDEIMINGEIAVSQCILRNPQVVQFSSLTEKLSIYSYEGRGIESVDLIDCLSLKELVIGDKCFVDVRSFALQNNPSIESVEIGQFSFYSHEGTQIHPLPFKEKHRILSKRKNASIRNCSNLRILRIGNESFVDFISFELSNMPSLMICQIGEPSDHCNEYGLNFYWCKNICIQKLPSLQCLQLGNFSFYYCFHCVIDCKFII